MNILKPKLTRILTGSTLGVLALGLMVHLASAVTTGDSPETLMQQGTEAFQRGAFDEALTKWKGAAQLYERDDKPREQSQARVQAALAAQEVGQVRQALQQLELAWILAQQTQDASRMTLVLGGLGTTYLATHQMDAAEHYLAQALEQARRHNTSELLAPALNDMGILRMMQGQNREALNTFKESVSVAQDAGQPALVARVRINAARAALRLQLLRDARSWLDQAFADIQNAGTSHEKAFGLINVGLAYADLRASLQSERDTILLKAADAFDLAAVTANDIRDPRTRSYALGYLGHLYETENRYEEALVLTRQAVFIAQSVNASEALYRWQWQMGRLLAALNRLDDAIGAYQNATFTFESIRMDVALAAKLPASTEPESIRPLYFEYADLLIQRAAHMDEGEPTQRYLTAARDAIEASKTAELRDYFKDECVDAAQSSISSVEAISQTTVVVYPIIFADRTELLLNLPGGLKHMAIPVTLTQLTQEVRTFRRLLEKRTTSDFLPHAQKLYDWLIRPLEPILAKFPIDTLVIVPDGPLRTIPMAALHDGKQFLIGKYAVAITPGLHLTDSRPLGRTRVKVLSAGLTEGVQGFPPLPYAAAELEALNALYRSRPLVNREFRTSTLENVMREQPFTIVHIATHGEFESRVEDTFLLTFDDKLTMNGLARAVGFSRFRMEKLELLTLSACETAVGDDRAALGLAGVAIKAGASSALATLWFISDEASSMLVSEFYKQLHDSPVSKAVALQKAQLKMLTNPVYDHPAYWAPFLLLNNWL